MKIVFIISSFSGGGAEKQCAFLINELSKDPLFEISVLYFFEGINFDLLDKVNINLQKIDSNSLYKFSNISKIAKQIDVIQPEIIFSWLHACDVYSYFLKRRLPKIKWIMAERDSSYPCFNFRYILRNILGKYADMIIANSEKGKQYWIKKGVEVNKIHVVSNIIKPYHGEKSSEVIGSPVILYAGRLEAQKNVFNISKAFCELSKKYPNAGFYIIGNGTLRYKIERYISENTSHNNVHIFPFKKNVNAFFKSTDIFVNVSFHEGLPNTVIENLMLNNKIVVSSINEHRFLFGDNYPLYVHDLNNIQHIVEIIEKAILIEDCRIYYSVANYKIKTMTATNIINTYKSYFKLLK